MLKVKNKYIDFLGIGAQKAGTTWLWYMFVQLSEFTLPPIKELHYFDRSTKYPTPNKLAETYLVNRLRDVNWVKHMIKTSLYHLRHTEFKQFPWLFKWFFSNYTDQWYLSLFRSFNGITGEVSPSYAILEEEDIRRMAELIPHVKIIYFLRNPIDRAWSLYRFSKGKHYGKQMGGTDIVSMDRIFSEKGNELRSDYLRTVENYSKYFPAEQILICFYDAIIDKPEELLSDIVRFLGGDPARIQHECNLKARINVSPEMDMPDEVRMYLKEKYYDMMKELSERLGGYCTNWFDDLNGTNHKDYPLLPTLHFNKKYQLGRENIL